MGIFSTNRVSSVVAESAAVVEENLEFTPDAGLGHLMEACIQLHENDARMFDTLLELDFVSATNEATLLEAEATEANNAANVSKMEQIKKKILEIIDGVVRAIKAAAGNVIAKITDLVKADSKIYDTYKDVLKMENMEGFGGIPNYAFPKDLISKKDIDTELVAKCRELANHVKSLDSKESIDAKLEEVKNLAKASQEENKKDNFRKDFFEERQEYWKPSSDQQLRKMLGATKAASEIISGIKETASKSIKEMNDYKKTVADELKAGKKGTELEVYKLKTVYDLVSICSKSMTKEFSAYTNTAIAQLGAYRKAAILCGRYAAKKAKGEVPTSEEDVKTESMIMYALAESSDEFVAEYFGY